MRYHAVRLILHVGLLLALAGGTHAQPDFLDPDALREAGLAKHWQLQLPLERDQTLRSLYLLDDQLYVGTHDGLVYGIHAPTGVVRWLREVTRAGYRLRRPAHQADLVIFSTPTDLQTYNRRTGDPVERLELRFPCSSPVVTDGQRLYVGGVDRRMYAINAETKFVDWRVLARGPVASAPVMHGEVLYFASTDGTVYGCVRENREFRWEFSTLDRIDADLAIGEWGVYVACTDYSLYLLDLEYGRVRWRARFSGPLFEAPVVTDELVYQFSDSDGLVAVEGTTDPTIDERIRWKLPSGRLALTVVDGTVYALARHGALLAVTTAKGALKTSVPAPNFTLGVPSIREPMVIMATPDGRLFCARRQGTPWLKPEDLSSAYRPAAQPAQETAAEPSAAAPGAAFRVGRSPTAPSDRVLLGGRSEVTRRFQSGEAASEPNSTGPTTRPAR